MALRGKRSRDIARAVGISEPMLSRVLADRRQVDPPLIERIRGAIFAEPSE